MTPLLKLSEWQMVWPKVHLILTKLSKLNKLDDIEHCLHNLASSVSGIEMLMSQLEKEVSVLDSKTKTINKSVDELKELKMKSLI